MAPIMFAMITKSASEMLFDILLVSINLFNESFLRVLTLFKLSRNLFDLPFKLMWNLGKSGNWDVIWSHLKILKGAGNLWKADLWN